MRVSGKGSFILLHMCFNTTVIIDLMEIWKFCEVRNCIDFAKSNIQYCCRLHSEFQIHQFTIVVSDGGTELSMNICSYIYLKFVQQKDLCYFYYIRLSILPGTFDK